MKQTETPKFREWFGRSQVVDAAGHPLIVYHGTATAFTEFNAFGAIGTHFGTEEQANSFTRGKRWKGQGSGNLTGGRVIPVYLNLQNPLRTQDAGAWDNAWQAWNAVRKATRGTVADITAAEEWKNLVQSADRAPETRQPLFDWLRRQVEEMDYDGIVYKNQNEGRGNLSYIAFHPYQICSALVPLVPIRSVSIAVDASVEAGLEPDL